MIAGTYLMLPLSQTIGTVASANFGVSSTDEGTVSRQAVRHLAAFNSRAHPEIWATKLVQGRSTLLAQNAKAIAALLPRPQGRKPTVGICVGAAHFDIETELLRSLPARMERLASFWGRDTLFHERFILRIDPSPSPRNPGELSCRFTLLEDPAFPKE